MYIYIIFEKGGNSFNHIETYNKFKAKFLPESRHNSVSNHEIDLDGYNLIRKDRNRHSGGVAMFVRNTINYKIRADIMPENLEKQRKLHQNPKNQA